MLDFIFNSIKLYLYCYKHMVLNLMILNTGAIISW